MRIWESLSDEKELVLQTIQGVHANQHLNTLTPAAKSEVLAILVPHCRDAPTALAAMKILYTITTHREFVEVLKRIGNVTRKGSVQTMMTNYYRLINRGLFVSPQAENAQQWLRSVLTV